MQIIPLYHESIVQLKATTPCNFARSERGAILPYNPFGTAICKLKLTRTLPLTHNFTVSLANKSRPAESEYIFNGIITSSKTRLNGIISDFSKNNIIKLPLN